MLDWLFLMYVFLAAIFLFISIFIPEEKYEEPYWKTMFCVVSTVLWFILALINMDIQTAYPAYNSTTGNTTLIYDTYVNEGNIYFSYFFGLMGTLGIIYTIVLIFGRFYEEQDKKNQDKDDETE